MGVNRLTELDGLRGIAALAVVLFHYVYHYNSIYGHSFDPLGIFQIGYYGVHLFFMISGFVIYWTISRSEKPLDFVWSRLSRLYPVFWAAVLVTFSVVSTFSLEGREHDIGVFAANLLMFHEYLNFPHIDGVYWTLTLELAFYFWILVIFCLGQINHIEKILIAWVVLAVLLTSEAAGLDFDTKYNKIFLLDYIEFFAAGIGFYKYKARSNSAWTLTLLMTTLGALYVRYDIELAIGLSSFYVLFSLLIVGKATLLKSKVLVYLGAVSYPLYLIHQNVGYVIINGFYETSLNPIFGIVVAIASSLIVAHVLMAFVERPSLKFLRKAYKENETLQRLGEKLRFWSQR